MIIDHPLHELLKPAIREGVTAALAEDIGSGDVSAALVPPSELAAATIVCRQPAVLCGIPWVNETFLHCDPDSEIQWFLADADKVEAGTILAEVRGSARALLSAERTALNFLQTLSGTATLSSQYARLVAHTHVKLLDTRKTIPGLRLAQKYAVRCGGCYNHRTGLYDAFLIKENHILAAGSIRKAVAAARSLAPDLSIEVEVENFQELVTALESQVDTILLDNFTLDDMRQAVNECAGRARLEASGNINMTNVAEVAETGVDCISIGDLTKRILPIDLSMRFTTP